MKKPFIVLSLVLLTVFVFISCDNSNNQVSRPAEDPFTASGCPKTFNGTFINKDNIDEVGIMEDCVEMFGDFDFKPDDIDENGEVKDGIYSFADNTIYIEVRGDVSTIKYYGYSLESTLGPDLEPEIFKLWGVYILDSSENGSYLYNMVIKRGDKAVKVEFKSDPDGYIKINGETIENEAPGEQNA